MSDMQAQMDIDTQAQMEADGRWSGIDDRGNVAYLVHDTAWGAAYVTPLKVYLSRPEAELARDAAEKLTSQHAGWTISPFRYEGALGAAVRLDVRFVGYGQPYDVKVSENGRVVADVYESDLPY